MGEATPLYNPNDRLTGRDGGPYLDQEEQRVAEERRARIEGRKPDLKNPPATAGIQLSTAAQMLATVDVNVPSKTHETGPEADRMFRAAAKNKDTELQQISEIPDTVKEPLKKGETPASANVFDPVNTDEDDDDEDEDEYFDLTLTSPPSDDDKK